MSLARRTGPPVTIAEFDAIVEQAGDDARLYELIGGVVTMMTNPTRRHEKIVMNIGARLKLAMDRRGCSTFLGGMRVQRETSGIGLDKLKPDIVVRCGPSSREDDLLNYITDPVIVVEVLSPSTIDYDRGPKLEFYKSLPPIKHVVLVYQDQLRIEHYVRDAGGEGADNGIGAWRHEDLAVLTRPGDVLSLSAVEFEMPAADAYLGVEF